jgi:hypothetical protein
MKRSIAAMLCAFSLLAATRLPSGAEESAAPKTDSDASQTSSKSSSSGPIGRLGGMFSKVPKNVPAFVAGVVVGTPIAFVRMSKREVVSATRELVGETENPLILAPASVLGVPAGIMSGGIYGLAHAIGNAWTNADDNPFSKDSFSLGDMK